MKEKTLKEVADYNLESQGLNRQKSQNGITLVALVVTIIVLLILAGITIMTLFGDNGLITMAQKAKSETENAQANSMTEIGSLGNQMNDVLNEIVNNTGDGISASAIATATDKSTYYGKTVKYEVKSDFKINDTTSLQDVLKSENIEWKIFYADNSNIYLIASDYIKYNCCPPSATQAISVNSAYKLGMGRVIKDYAGSTSITDTKLQALNSDYYKYLSNNSTSSKNTNMQAVAYMMDTNVWSRFAGEKAEYAIGGPTLEMLFNSYNQSYPELKNGEGKYKYQVRVLSTTGYQISYDYGTSWRNSMGNAADYLDADNSLYVINSQSKAIAMWLASPSASGTSIVVGLDYSGNIRSDGGYASLSRGFRPIVALKSGIQLEAGTESDGVDFVIKSLN